MAGKSGACVASHIAYETVPTLGKTLLNFKYLKIMFDLCTPNVEAEAFPKLRECSRQFERDEWLFENGNLA